MKGRRPRGNEEDARIFFLKSKTELVRGFLYLCSLLFFAPESTKSLSLSLSFPSLRVFLRPSVCACVSVEARAVVGKRNIIEESFIFFSFFFVAQRRFLPFWCLYPNNLAEGKGQNREISLKIMDSRTQIGK